tara:strand:- start:1165 stop:1479 length:315 start_codon:yes stop_codon:yes gene_type:complete
MAPREITNLKIEANVFSRHKTLRDWFFYRTELTISQILLESEDHIDQIEMVQEDLWNYTHELLESLVEEELYELADKVNKQTEKLTEESSKILRGEYELYKARK